jgi:hypothetical protein
MAIEDIPGSYTTASGPPLPTCAVQKVVSYLRTRGRTGRATGTAVHAPKPP